MQKVNIVLVDDFDGDEAAETVTFGLDGHTYEIDLNEVNATELRDTLAPWVEKARVTGRRRKNARRPKRQAAAVSTRQRVHNGKVQVASTKEIRAWARDNGYTVGQKGTIKADVREAYAAAH